MSLEKAVTAVWPLNLEEWNIEKIEKLLKSKH